MQLTRLALREEVPLDESLSTQPRVVRLITRLNIGGPARQALLLTKELSPEYPTTLGAGTPPPEEGELSDPSVAVHRLPLVRPVRPATDIRALFATRSLLRSQRPFIVHSHMAKAGAIGRVASATLRPRPMMVHTYHGHVLEGYFPPRIERAFIALERRLARKTDVLIAVSGEVRDSLLSLGIGTEAQYRVIPLGLELEPFLRVERASGLLRTVKGIPASVPLVGIVGRLTAIKDQSSMLAAMTRLPGVHLAVIGDGEDRVMLESRANELGVRARTHFFGWMTNVAQAISDLDLVVLTSRNEGTPVALIEALAANKAVVATDVGGVRSVVSHGATGLLVPPGDVDAIALAVSRLLEDDEQRIRMGSVGREEMARRFDQKHLCDAIRDLYDELAESLKARSTR